MVILGIETSCDETAVALVKDGCDVLSSVVYSQIDTHKVFGGVVPEVAAREHLRLLGTIVQEAMSQSKLTIDQVDAIAVTQGPGLIGALLVGVSYAKGLANSTNKPLIPVNHVHAHIHGALLDGKEAVYPCLGLVVSGGHTNIYYMTSPIDFQLMAYTMDDACGECFDKVAKLFNLGYPGGPQVERLAGNADPDAIPMPKTLQSTQGDKQKLMFSYSGLKTYMLNLRRQDAAESLTPERTAHILSAFQQEALGQLVRKLRLALQLKPLTRQIVVAGGVAANQKFRAMMARDIDVEVRFPNMKYCSDNAAMIAGLGFYQFTASSKDRSRFFQSDWDCYSRYPFHEFLQGAE